MPQSTYRVSGILLSYDCAEFIGAALRSVLAQDSEPMQVIVSDDRSTDGTYEILEEEIADYRGPHRVELRQRDETSGSKSAHLNDVLPLAEGEIIVSFDGDDVSAPVRVRRLLQTFDTEPAVHAVYSRFCLIDEAGRYLGAGNVPHPPPGAAADRWFSRVDAYAAGTTLAVRRKVVETFGPLDPDIHEDIVLPFRASLLGDVRYLDEELVGVRRRSDSLTAHFDRFDSLESYRRRMHQGIEQARKHLRRRLADLDTARSKMPERTDHFSELASLARTSMDHAEATAALTSASRRERLAAVWQLWCKGAYREEFAQNLALALVPEQYLRIKRGRLRTSRGGSRAPASAPWPPRPDTPAEHD